MQLWIMRYALKGLQIFVEDSEAREGEGGDEEEEEEEEVKENKKKNRERRGFEEECSVRGTNERRED